MNQLKNVLIKVLTADGGNDEIMSLVNALTEAELDALAEVFCFSYKLKINEREKSLN